MNGWYLLVLTEKRVYAALFLAFGDIRSFGPMRLACVGEGTAKIFRNHCLEVELVPEKSSAESLAKELIASNSRWIVPMFWW